MLLLKEIFSLKLFISASHQTGIDTRSFFYIARVLVKGEFVQELRHVLCWIILVIDSLPAM